MLGVAHSVDSLTVWASPGGARGWDAGDRNDEWGAGTGREKIASRIREVDQSADLACARYDMRGGCIVYWQS